MKKTKNIKTEKEKKIKKNSSRSNSTFNSNKSQKDREKSRMKKIEDTKEIEEQELENKRIAIAKDLQEETKNKKNAKKNEDKQKAEENTISIKPAKQTSVQNKKEMQKMKSSLSVAKIGRKKVNIKKMAKELEMQEKDDYIPEPIKWNEVDVTNVIEKYKDKSVSKSYEKSIDPSKSKKHIVYELEKFEDFQESYNARTDLISSYKGQDVDFNKIGDPAAIKKLRNMTFDSFGTFEKKERDAKKNSSNAKPKTQSKTKPKAKPKAKK